jgi:hypothetical protein
MTVLRLSKDALDKIIGGEVNTRSTCVVKFYSPTCKMCHALSGIYKKMAEEKKYKDKIHFFAMNVEDYLQAEADLGFEGVPTILGIRMSNKPGRHKEFNYNTQIHKMPEPTHEDSHPETWYHPEDIEKFIDRKLLGIK